MERQEEERMRAYIKAVFSDICALSVESHYEYQYEPMERKHGLFFFFFFSLGYSCTQEIYSSQCNGRSLSLRMVVWTVQPRLCIFSLPLMSVAGLVSVNNTLCQVQLWRTLQYVNQVGLNASMSRVRRHHSATAPNPQFSQYHFLVFSYSLSSPLPRPFPLVLRDIESKGCKSTHFLPPFPHLQTQIAPGQSQAFLYAEPVTGVTHHSPPVPSLTSSEPHSHSAACMKLCDWFGTVITIRE